MGLHWQFGVVQGASAVDNTYSLAFIKTAVDGDVGTSVRIARAGINPKTELMTGGQDRIFLVTEPGSNEQLISYSYNDTNISTAIFETDNIEGDISLNTHNPRGTCFANNGSFLYVIGLASPYLKRYALSTPYDLSSVAATTTADTSSFASPQGIAFKTDGSVMFLPESNNADVKVVGLSTNYDITSTFSTSTVSLAVTDDDGDTITALFGIRFNPDGTKVFVCYKSNDTPKVAEFSLSTPFDLSTKTFVTSLNLGGRLGNFDATTFASPAGLDWNSDGSELYVAGLHEDFNDSSPKQSKVAQLSGTPGNVFTPKVVSDMDIGSITFNTQFSGNGQSSASPLVYEALSALEIEVSSTGLVPGAGDITMAIKTLTDDGINFDNLGHVSYSWSIVNFADKAGNFNFPTNWVGTTATSRVWDTLRIDVPALGFEESEHTIRVRCVINTQAFGDTFVDFVFPIIFIEV
jgi:sugar lactone lactonase YvrE